MGRWVSFLCCFIDFVLGWVMGWRWRDKEASDE